MPLKPKTHRQTLRHQQAKPRDERPSPSRRGYGRTWRRLRLMQLSRHPLCKTCEERGYLTPAKDVHHVVPLSQGGQSSLENLESLCHMHHSQETAYHAGFGRQAHDNG